MQLAVTQALAALEAGEPARARAHLDGVSALVAGHEPAARVFGLFHLNTGDYAAAVTWFERALALRPDSAQAAAGRAVALQRLNRPLEALAGLEAVLRQDPENHEALHMSGVILQSLGRSFEALKAYDEALLIKPDQCEILLNRSTLLEQLGRLEEALSSLDRVLALKPDDPTAQFNRGCILQKLGRLDEALAAYEAAALCGANPEAWLNRGNVLQRLERFAEAKACYDGALRLRPDYPQARYNRAIAAQRLGQLGEALADLDAALAQKPDYAEALCNRGNILGQLGRREAALASYERALTIRPGFRQAELNRANILFALARFEPALAAASAILDQEPEHPQALCICGAALQRLGKLDEALLKFNAAIAARPAYPEAWLNHGNVLQELGRFEEALASYHQALALRPLYPEVLSSRGVALKELGRLDEALASIVAALKLKPDYPDARNNLSGLLLILGDLKRGFAAFESRWERSNAPRRTIISPLPTWNGEEIGGRRILVWDEQGLGDLIQFCRYLPLLVARGAKVTLLGRKSMFRLIKTLPAAPRFVEAIDDHEHYDYQIALMSLPYAFGTTLETVPAAVPYLHAEPQRVAEWAARIGDEGFRIGICRRGNLNINLERSVPLESFGQLAAIEGVRLISLAKDPEPAPDFPVESLGPSLDGGADAFIDTAAIMAHCHLIVTSDTSIAHLAGALGRPVFLALKYMPDWRWLATGEYSPWYPTMRLFLQKKRGDWEPVFDEIAEAVRALPIPRSKRPPEKRGAA